MHVCIDIQSAVSQRAGVGRYTKMLVQHLAALADGRDLSLFYMDFTRKCQTFPTGGATLHGWRWAPGRVVQGAWKTVSFPPFNWLAGRADVYHFPNFTRPPLTAGASVVTVHDAAFLRLPETLEAKNLAYLRSRMRDTIDRADAILTVSQFTANELRELMGAPEAKLHPVWSGIDPDMKRAPDAAVAAARSRHALARPYLLSVGTLEPRKNFPFLVDVFDDLPDFDGDLVLVGRPGWKYEPILARIHASPRRARIRVIEHLGEDELPALYSGAELFVLPSLYEGFGFPPLEAMACGTPALVSVGGALAETCAGGAEIVPDLEVDAWVAAIARALGDSARRADMRAAGLAHAARFTWAETARKTWRVYEQTAEAAR